MLPARHELPATQGNCFSRALLRREKFSQVIDRAQSVEMINTERFFSPYQALAIQSFGLVQLAEFFLEGGLVVQLSKHLGVMIAELSGQSVLRCSREGQGLRLPFQCRESLQHLGHRGQGVIVIGPEFLLPLMQTALQHIKGCHCFTGSKQITPKSVHREQHVLLGSVIIYCF
jgi:hypothetical protein